ncbi:MAG: hypothetical protein AAF512_23125 [Pseudomonadota bacterium]
MAAITLILLVLLGTLGASQWLLEKWPDGRSFIDGIAPYKVWIGVVGAAWGIWLALRCILYFFAYLQAPLLLAIVIATAVVLILLGLLMGREKFREWLGSEPTAHERMEEVAVKAEPHQRNLGIAALALAVVNLLSMLGV